VSPLQSILAVAVGGSVLAACGRPATPTGRADATGAQQPAAPPTASPSPTHFPGTTVRITVNGEELKQGSTAELTGDTTLILTFPLPMDRASVERWLPQSASIAWTNDQTVALSIPSTENNPAFKVPESVSQDGSTIVDIFFVALSLPPSIVVSIYSVDELLAGARPPRDTAVRVAARDARVFSPDGGKVLLYPTPGRTPAGPPRIFDLATRSMATLPVPPRANGPLVLGAWAGSDRVVLVGDGVWVGLADGTGVRAVSDLRGFGTPEAAAVSPRGTFVALEWSDRLAVLDLGTGAIRTITNHHVECGPLSIAWSLDERRVATVECAAANPAPRVRIVEVAADRTVKTIDGGEMGVMPLLTGDFAIPRDSGQQGEGARRLIVVFSFDGTEKARHLGYAPTLSPDGRYLLDGTCCAGEGFVLADLRAPDQTQRTIAGSAMWLSDGRVLVLMRSAGVR
jgi:hypothetical protein